MTTGHPRGSAREAPLQMTCVGSESLPPAVRTKEPRLVFEPPAPRSPSVRGMGDVSWLCAGLRRGRGEAACALGPRARAGGVGARPLGGEEAQRARRPAPSAHSLSSSGTAALGHADSTDSDSSVLLRPKNQGHPSLRAHVPGQQRGGCLSTPTQDFLRLCSDGGPPCRGRLTCVCCSLSPR